MKDICSHNECTGCTACSSICGKTAITFKQDSLGFLYPTIDDDKCVECDLCRIICPNNNHLLKSFPKASYVGYAVSKEEQLSSSSGGVASVVGRYFVKSGGIVYGCSADSIDEICHIRVDNEKELAKLKGSKYVQSNMSNCYKQVHNDLRNGKKVLFVGTPCQVAGLKSYLRKPYTNLLTMDFVCHGVPSIKILKESLKSHFSGFSTENYGLSFRRKVMRGNKYKSEFGIFIHSKKEGWIYEGYYPKNMYITGFLSALFYRLSCYTCHYTTQERVSDITVGDYSDVSGEYDNLEGKKRLLSMISVNTYQGQTLLKYLQDVLCIKEIDYSKIVAAQGQLRHPMKLHRGRADFEKNFTYEQFDHLVKRILNQDLKRIRKIILATKIRNMLFSIPGIKSIYKKRKKR